MLRQLVIRDYLLVREITLEFASGLTVLTGETGAGKSMVLGALDVLLGARFPKDAVRPGAERAVIEGSFVLDKPDDVRDVVGADYFDDSEELLLRREISRQGRTRSWLNDHPLPLEMVQKLRDALADFHGQREHQSLFSSAVQLDYLDAYAGTAEDVEIVSRSFLQRSVLKKELEQTQAALSTHRKDRVLLQYQFEEIERLGLTAGEEEAIGAKLVKLESAEKLSAEAARLLDLLEESNPSLVGMCGIAKATAGGIAKIDREIEPVLNDLADVTSRLKDLAQQVRHYLDGLTFDDAELARLRDRRGVIWELRRKHGLTVEQILARAGELKTLLEQGETLERKCEDLGAALKKADAELVASAGSLSRKRRTAAKEFDQQVFESLKPLGFAQPEFEAHLETLPEPFDANRISVNGADSVEFRFSANIGSKPAPIGAVASGGESSRVTLAIKTVLSEKADYPLLVYDEIDLGISGRVADQVGKALSSLARRHQVLVITHLPQIASRADHHLSIQKSVRGETTETSARFLTDQQRVQAIASLIAGAKITDRALASASELLRQSGKLKTLSSDLG
jgi:DNA repair protein RecN (Recombination protein N)